MTTMRSGVAFARLPVSSSRLIESLVSSLHHSIPSTTTLSFKHSFRLSSQPRPFPTLANRLFTTRCNKRSRCRSLLFRVALVRWNLHISIQCNRLTTCTSPFASLPCPRASTYHTSPAACVLRLCLLRHDDGRQDHEAGLFSRTAAQAPWVLLGTQAARSN